MKNKKMSLIYIVYGVLTVACLVYIHFFSFDSSHWSLFVFPLWVFGGIYLYRGIKDLSTSETLSKGQFAPRFSSNQVSSGSNKKILLSNIPVAIITTIITIIFLTISENIWVLLPAVQFLLAYFTFTVLWYLFRSKSKGTKQEKSTTSGDRLRTKFWIIFVLTLPLYIVTIMDAQLVIGGVISDARKPVFFSDYSQAFNDISVGDSRAIIDTLIDEAATDNKRAYFGFWSIELSDSLDDYVNTNKEKFSKEETNWFYEGVKYKAGLFWFMDNLKHCVPDLSYIEVKLSHKKDIRYMYLISSDTIIGLSKYSAIKSQDGSKWDIAYSDDLPASRIDVSPRGVLEICSEELTNDYFSSLLIKEDGALRLLPFVTCSVAYPSEFTYEICERPLRNKDYNRAIKTEFFRNLLEEGADPQYESSANQIAPEVPRDPSKVYFSL